MLAFEADDCYIVALELFFAQDIAHVTEHSLPASAMPDSAISLAGFQVSTYGRFWVSPEVLDARAKDRGVAR